MQLFRQMRRRSGLTLQDEICRQKGRNALERDLHIGPGIAVHIRLQHTARKADLAGDAGEGSATNKGKGLVTRKPRICVNP